MLLTLLLPMISGAGYDWNTYGNGYSPSHQAQYEGIFSGFDDEISSYNTTLAGQDQYTHPTQPLVDDFGDSNINYVVVADGDYLKLFDDNLNLYTELYLSYQSIGQLGVVDWGNDGGSDIAGFFRENATQLHFKVFEVNHTTQIINEIYDYNFSWFETNSISGVRCSGNECYTILMDGNASAGYIWTSMVINSTGVTAHQLYATRGENPYPVIEPPSSIDYNNDSVQDYLIFSEKRAVVYNELGTILANWSFGGSVDYGGVTIPNQYIRSAKFFNADASPYWKVAIAVDIPSQTWVNNICGDLGCSRIYVKNVIDSSEVFSDNCLGAGLNSGNNPRFQGLAIIDYNGDFYDDIWCSGARIGTNPMSNLKIYKGDGTILYSDETLGAGWGTEYPSSSMTLARMDSDSSYDAIIYSSGQLRIWSPATDSMMYSSTIPTISGQGTCVPSDLDFDGFLDLVCSDTDSIAQLTTNLINYNSYILQVAYDPSTLLAINETLNAIISATDNEGDNILYRHRCYDADNWSAEDGSNVKTCSYASVGTYVLSVGVRDSYHSTYTTFPQTIIVTSTGAVCDNDFICEAGQGETYLNCPNDCASPEEEEIPDTTTATGGMTLPTKLVDTENLNQGLLPEIYYGTLGFFSSVLSPFIVLVFVIFFALIILTIGTIIKKIAGKVGDMR